MTKIPLILLISLATFTGIIGISPLLTSPTNPFYNIDPETVYVSNAIQFLTTGKIAFNDHPGTPVIFLLSSLYSPLKFITGSNFLVWTVINYENLFWLTRMAFFILFLTGYFFLHYVVYRTFKSAVVNIFLFLILFIDPLFIEITTKISPEPLALLFFSLWLLILFVFQKSRQVHLLKVLGFLAGLLIATKTVYLSVALATIYVAQRQYLLVAKYIFIGFVIGIFPAIREIGQITSWQLRALTRVGRSGTGDLGLFSPSQYLQAAKYWLTHRWGVFLLLIPPSTILLRKRTNRVFKAIFLSGVIGWLTFLKYEEYRYQTGNLLLLAASSVYYFSQSSRILRSILLTLAIFLAVNYIPRDWTYKRGLVVQAAYLQLFIDQFSPNDDIIWEAADSKDFALIRGRGWSDRVYNPALRQIKPHLWELRVPDMVTLVDHSDQVHDITSFCWDGLIIQAKSYDKYFLPRQKHPENYRVETIPGTQMLFATTKCFPISSPQI